MVRFITIEGGEGVGKSSFAKMLSSEIERWDLDVLNTREPGGTKVADQIRQIFLIPPQDEPLLPNAELCLVSAARAQHVEHVIRPALNQGCWVLCDRFSDSTRVYQGYLGNISSEHVEYLIKLSTNGVEPDLTFVLDCPVEISLARVEKRNPSKTGETANRYDLATVNTHKALRRAFLQIAEDYSDRVVVIDASGSVEHAVAQAVSVLKDRF